jgi:hypothetical protein
MASTATSTSAAASYDLAFQISPIVLQGGIAASAPGGIMPIVNITNLRTSAVFARYLPLPGSTIIANQVPTYSLANQQVAANAIVAQPLTLSMRMIAPVNTEGGYLTKLPLFQAFQSALASHNAQGGTYAIATPAFVYNAMLMLGMTDISEGESMQQQIEWQLDFTAPVLTFAGVQASQNVLMGQITAGNQINGTPSNTGNSQAPDPTLAGITAALAQFGGNI